VEETVVWADGESVSYCYGRGQGLSNAHQLLGVIMLAMGSRRVESCFLVIRLGGVMVTILFLGNNLGGLVKRFLFILQKEIFSPRVRGRVKIDSGSLMERLRFVPDVVKRFLAVFDTLELR